VPSQAARSLNKRKHQAMIGLLFPKPKRRHKTRKFLKRSGKRITGKNSFKGWYPGCKIIRRRTDPDVHAYAATVRAKLRREMPRAQQIFNEMLDKERILYESEKYSQNGDVPLFIDAYVRSKKIGFEIDGSSHDNTEYNDAGRNKWLWYWHGIRVYRFTNQDVYNRLTWVRQRVIEALSE
jgi:very-short-patch-repair endonuclease